MKINIYIHILILWRWTLIYKIALFNVHILFYVVTTHYHLWSDYIIIKRPVAKFLCYPVNVNVHTRLPVLDISQKGDAHIRWLKKVIGLEASLRCLHSFSHVNPDYTFSGYSCRQLTCVDWLQDRFLIDHNVIFMNFYYLIIV